MFAEHEVLNHFLNRVSKTPHNFYKAFVSRICKPHQNKPNSKGEEALVFPKGFVRAFSGTKRGRGGSKVTIRRRLEVVEAPR